MRSRIWHSHSSQRSSCHFFDDGGRSDSLGLGALDVAGLGLVGGIWNKRSRGGTVFPLRSLAVSLLALCAGFYFPEHYFIFILPAVSLLVALQSARCRILSPVGAASFGFTRVLVFCIALTQPILAERNCILKFLVLKPIE